MKTNFWKKEFFGGCAIFFAAIVLIALFMLIINYETTKNTFDIALSVIRILFLAAFSFVFSFANTFYGVDTMKEWFRLALHFILTAFGFFLFIYYPVSAEITAAGGNLPTENAIILLSLFTVVYFLIFGAVKLAKLIIKKNKAKKEEYQPVYKKQSRK